MIMERAQALARRITRFPDIILITAYPHWVPSSHHWDAAADPNQVLMGV
jgi:hypothetical protein